MNQNIQGKKIYGRGYNPSSHWRSDENNKNIQRHSLTRGSGGRRVSHAHYAFWCNGHEFDLRYRSWRSFTSKNKKTITNIISNYFIILFRCNSEHFEWLEYKCLKQNIVIVLYIKHEPNYTSSKTIHFE